MKGDNEEPIDDPVDEDPRPPVYDIKSTTKKYGRNASRGLSNTSW